MYDAQPDFQLNFEGAKWQYKEIYDFLVLNVFKDFNFRIPSKWSHLVHYFYLYIDYTNMSSNRESYFITILPNSNDEFNETILLMLMKVGKAHAHHLVSFE